MRSVALLFALSLLSAYPHPAAADTAAAESRAKRVETEVESPTLESGARSLARLKRNPTSTEKARTSTGFRESLIKGRGPVTIPAGKAEEGDHAEHESPSSGQNDGKPIRRMPADWVQRLRENQSNKKP